MQKTWRLIFVAQLLISVEFKNGIASETFELLYFFAANRVTGEHVDQQSSNQIKLAALQSLGMISA